MKTAQMLIPSERILDKNLNRPTSCICSIIRSCTNINIIFKHKQITWFKYLFRVIIKQGVSVVSQATAEANNLSAVAASKETYHQLMEAVCGGAKPYLSTAHLESEHFRIKDKSMELFTKKPKMGGEEFSRQYKEKLDQVRYKLTLYRTCYFILRCRQDRVLTIKFCYSLKRLLKYHYA